MKKMRALSIGLALLPIVALVGTSAFAAEPAPSIKSIARPVAGYSEIVFHGGSGPFQVQARADLDPATPWVDMSDALVTEIGPGVFLGQFPNGKDDLALYRVVSQSDGITDLKGWTVLLKVSPPANGSYFVVGESPTVTVTILDNFAQGLGRPDFGSLNLYMYGPQDPRQTVTASKLLNANTNRATRPHHYIDLKTNPDVQITGNTLTYHLKPVTDELPGTYTVSLWSVLASDNVQQIMKFSNIQVGTATVEPSLVEDATTGLSSCAACHKGPISGRLYMHHIDPGFSPTGNWALDYTPVKSCKSCHNNDGYAAYSDPSAGGSVPDPIIRRVHGVHMGEGLKLPFNIDPVTGNFKDYIHLAFPSDVRGCAKCHVDDRWTTQLSRAACASCHDNVWFGSSTAVPAGMVLHTGKTVTDDSRCVLCHSADGIANGVDVSHDLTAPAYTLPPPAMNLVDVSLTPPANGTYYVAGETPTVSVVIRDDTGNAIDHTKVTDGNFSTASLFVYGPRAEAVPVLTSTAKNVNSKLRATVSNNQDGPWVINGKTFRIAINGSSPQDILMTGAGASNLVTAAEVVAALNPVITNLNGGAKATVSGLRVSIKTLIQGANARIEIYDGDVTTAMVWKRPPNTVMNPDVTIAAGSTPANDLRALSDPLDYLDPKVTRNVANVTYQLDDVAGLAPGTYHAYVYQLPKAGKVAGLSLVGIGIKEFQVGTATAEKKIATNCKDCHGDTIFHLTSGPQHPAPFDTDYCTACHDYLHTASGDAFKNQGGTSLNGWSGYGAVPIVRRVHGVHFAHYLEHSEEIYANATKSTFGEIIFPQDVRNCTKCHAQSDVWKQQPSRLACLACHDSDEAKTHGKLMTFLLDPADPYGPLSVETCVICHGEGRDFSPDKVHDIATPYVPPYPRDPALP